MDKFLHGSRNKHLGFWFPTGIYDLLNLIPVGHGLSVDLIIDNHTLLPFYEPFLPTHIATEFRAAMSGRVTTAVPTRGLGISKLSDDTRYLRFCPLCRDADRSQFGETYWRRLHQIPLVKVCPKHRVLLQDSTLERRTVLTRRDYLPADPACLSRRVVPIDSRDKSHGFFLWTAKQVQWLLDNKQADLGLPEIKEGYRSALHQQNLATIGGRIDVYKLREQFIAYYGDELLLIMNSPLSTDTKEFWLKQWMRSLHRFQSPQRHLMLIGLLGMTVKSFFAAIKQPQNDEKGPWSCLNPFSPCSKTFVIQSYRLQDRQPKAIFRCPECQYEYSRQFPLTSQDQDAPAYIRNRGPAWTDHLLKLWVNPSLSVQEISRQMGVTQPTVIQYAIREKFPIPRPGAQNWRPTRAMKEIAQKPTIKDRRSTLAMHRSKWLEHRARYPQHTRSELNKYCGSTYRWLSRNDKQWLEDHIPLPKVRPDSVVDWPKRDALLAPLVKDICTKLLIEAKKAITPPIRISVALVHQFLRDHGKKINLSNNSKKLPVTISVLNKYVCESDEDLMHRKIEWAIQHCRASSIRPTFSRFVILARLEMLKPKVRSADESIERAVASL